MPLVCETRRRAAKGCWCDYLGGPLADRRRELELFCLHLRLLPLCACCLLGGGGVLIAKRSEALPPPRTTAAATAADDDASAAAAAYARPLDNLRLGELLYKRWHLALLLKCLEGAKVATGGVEAHANRRANIATKEGSTLREELPVWLRHLRSVPRGGGGGSSRSRPTAVATPPVRCLLLLLLGVVGRGLPRPSLDCANGLLEELRRLRPHRRLPLRRRAVRLLRRQRLVGAPRRHQPLPLTARPAEGARGGDAAEHAFKWRGPPGGSARCASWSRRESPDGRGRVGEDPT